jgi:hypothetical protein
MDQRFPPCEICNGNGMVPVYHREYRGDPTVYREIVDPHGEVKTIRVPGVINAHCVCGLGEWMRSKLDDDVQRRIPRLADVNANRTNYRFDDPTFTADSTPEDTSAFVHKWRATFGKKQAGQKTDEKFGKQPPKTNKLTEQQFADQLYERTQREAREALAAEEAPR